MRSAGPRSQDRLVIVRFSAGVAVLECPRGAMELHQARYFLAVFEARNFTRAAERCSVSQPALSKAIKQLEDELGGPLFHRERGGAKLTTLGELVLPRFLRLVEECSSIGEIASNHLALRQVPVRVGVLSTIGPAQLALHLEEFKRRAPGVELELHVMGQGPLMTRLETAELELAVANGDLVRQDWVVARPLYRERYVVALPRGHRLEAKHQVSLRDLSGEPYIDRLACELRDAVGELCDASSIELYATYRTDREAWIECLVRAGVGVALLPEHSLVSDDTVRRPLHEPPVSRRIALLRSVEHASSPAARLLWETMVERASDRDDGTARP